MFGHLSPFGFASNRIVMRRLGYLFKPGFSAPQESDPKQNFCSPHRIHTLMRLMIRLHALDFERIECTGVIDQQTKKGLGLEGRNYLFPFHCSVEFLDFCIVGDYNFPVGSNSIHPRKVLFVGVHL